MFPARWENCQEWAIYTDIMTRDNRTAAARYIGPGRSQEGIHIQLKTYRSVNRGFPKGKADILNGSSGRMSR